MLVEFTFLLVDSQSCLMELLQKSCQCYVVPFLYTAENVENVENDVTHIHGTWDIPDLVVCDFWECFAF